MRQRTAPGCRHHCAVQVLQKWLGVVVGDGHDGDFGQRLDFAERQLLCAGDCANAGSGGVAGIDGHVHDAAALRAEFGGRMGPLG